MLTINASPLRIISGLRPSESASTPANNVENTLPSSTAVTITESCAAVRREVAIQIGQRASDNPHVDSIQQSAQASDDQQKEVLTAL
jgi:hypothetical protein